VAMARPAAQGRGLAPDPMTCAGFRSNGR
jgi:hypothetical protein